MATPKDFEYIEGSPESKKSKIIRNTNMKLGMSMKKNNIDELLFKKKV